MYSLVLSLSSVHFVGRVIVRQVKPRYLSAALDCYIFSIATTSIILSSKYPLSVLQNVIAPLLANFWFASNKMFFSCV